MFKDIVVLIDDKQTDLRYTIENGEIICSFNIPLYCDTIEIVYDQNIYDYLEFSNEIETEKKGFGVIEIDPDSPYESTEFFKLTLNYKFFVKTSFKFVNGFIDLHALVDELKVFKKSKNGKEYETEIDSLIFEIEAKSVDELLLQDKDEKDRLINLISTNKLYKTLAGKMNTQDIMFLLTSYIYCPRVPKVSQENFNALVIAAINSDDRLENVWRLGMSYDGAGLDYSLLDKFYVDSKNSWYLSEYISCIKQVDQQKITNMVLETKDKTFISDLLKDNFIQTHLDGQYQTALTEALNTLK